MSEAQARKPWGEAAGTFFFTLALGPPIGGITFALCVALYPAMGALAGKAGLEGDLSSVALVVLFVGLFAIPFSFLLGGLQAAATGLMLAASGWWLGAPPFWAAVVAGLLAYAGALLSGFSDVKEWYVPFLIIHMVPTLACWAVTRLFWSSYSP